MARRAEITFFESRIITLVPATTNSLARPASSNENAGTPASAATDGNTGTRWSSAFSDPQWLQVDLGTTDTITEVSINWEAAFGKSFQVQTSNDGTTWTNILTTTTGAGGIQDLTVTGRFVRMNGTVRGTQFGYSIWEFQVFGTVGTGGTGTCNTATNAALNKPATASSTENASFPASNAFDGNTGTRWSSAFSDPQWVQVDLGTSQTICQVTLTWEAAFAKSFQIQVSSSGTTWTNIFTTTTGAGGVQTLPVNGSGRFVRMNGTVRGTAFGYSLFEFAVFTTATGGGTGPIQGGGPLGPNVIVFDPSMSGATIQSQVDSVFATQQSNQFGAQRFALLFKPGSYSGFNAQIGFYTSIMGLGQNPDQVQIHGEITVDAGWNAGNATQNFWRSASDMEVFPSAGFTRWAVAQAGPFRRMDIQGDLNLAPNGFGFASGGYISDSRITGTVQPFSEPVVAAGRWRKYVAAGSRQDRSIDMDGR
jgi:F5/8 type C domain